MGITLCVIVKLIYLTSISNTPQDRRNPNPPNSYLDPNDLDQTDLYEYENNGSKLSNLINRGTIPLPRRDIIDSICSNINQTLLVAKFFYFFYFAAFGALFPLLSIYFKQMGMGTSYCGILMGFRPFVEFISAPFWGVVASRFRQAKIILLMALVSWILFTVSIGLIKTPPHSCWKQNSTHTTFEPLNNNAIRTVKKRDVFNNDESFTVRLKRQKFIIPINNTNYTQTILNRALELATNKTKLMNKINSIEYFNNTNKIQTAMEMIIDSIISTTTISKSKTPQLTTITTRRRKTTTTTPFTVHYEIEDDDNEDDTYPDQDTIKPTLPSLTTKTVMGNPIQISHTNLSLVKPLGTNILYLKNDVRNIFMLFLLLIVIGEFFSAPAITLADACTLNYLGQDTELYGRQRMWGSVGWGIAIFLVATILDQSKSLTIHPCGSNSTLQEKNYTVCFATFSVLMACALGIATQFRFTYNEGEQIPLKSFQDDLKHKVHHTSPRQRLINEDDDRGLSNTHSIITNEQQIQISIRNQQQHDNKHPFNASSSFYQRRASQTMKIMQLVQLFMTVKHGTFLFIAWWMGCGVGLVFTFLFWHLQDLGGSATLFGVASVINHISELFAYFFLHELIRRLGHIKILYLGLLGNTVRFVYISFLTNPWWVLPFEFIQGLTHAAVWATACSYLSQAAPENLRLSCQGILQGFHFGFGRGCGALFGGLLASAVGTDLTFRLYGISCLLMMVGFAILNHFYKDGHRHRTMSRPSLGNDPREYMPDSAFIAPHGVPSNPKWHTFSPGVTAGIRHDLASSPIPPNYYNQRMGTPSGKTMEYIKKGLQVKQGDIIRKPDKVASSVKKEF
ncbi:unnamed protein product [Didymodactylos carnosus]|uniref:Major facilitator superfamily associated domain-containing protein n=1 Tax=Didymodactylos carnosus TaxID=1234261 RepID=A0A814GQT4_9BILA|nr:unnamed protein product [Didymodactylos carnosus]CAF0999764.1 unnamed protein product [Didymodactylos carnosus]CAF3571795.1 unnamed protein product [Didymodactylos carnosus]CAF3771221.1 unnamed protein product [Didymodactylos carnosus]